MRFRFPIVIIDEDFRSENASGLGIRARQGDRERRRRSARSRASLQAYQIRVPAVPRLDVCPSDATLRPAIIGGVCRTPWQTQFDDNDRQPQLWEDPRWATQTFSSGFTASRVAAAAGGGQRDAGVSGRASGSPAASSSTRSTLPVVDSVQ